MKALKGVKLHRVLALMAMLLGALLPAYGQQEVDPTWYDPWGASKPAAVQPSQPRVATQRHQANVRPVSGRRVAAKARGKQATARPKAS